MLTCENKVNRAVVLEVNEWIAHGIQVECKSTCADKTEYDFYSPIND